MSDFSLNFMAVFAELANLQSAESNSRSNSFNNNNNNSFILVLHLFFIV